MTGAADSWEHVDLAALTRAQRYQMLTGAVVPRPIAFVTSVSPGGIVNAAPFSQFVILAVDPGLLGFSVGPRIKGTHAKDTLANVQASGDYVINLVPEGWEEIVQRAGEEHAAEVSEVELLGLDLVPSLHVAAPRLRGSPVQFECRLSQVLTFGDAPNHFVVGEIAAMHVRTGLVTGSKIAPALHRPIARIGGRNYVRLGDIVGVAGE